MGFGIDDMWLCQSSVGGQQKVTPLACQQSYKWIDYAADILMEPVVSSSTALAFLTNMSEKCKSTSLSAIQVKNR